MGRLFHFLALLGLFAYLTNGAQTHLRVLPGQTITVPICGDGLSRTLKITVGGEHQDTSGFSCCGDCLPPAPLPSNAPALPVNMVGFHLLPVTQGASAVYRRSSLWPGAPPRAPPVSGLI